MPKDAAYHESAIRYNERLADFAKGLEKSIAHPEIQKWCRAVAAQHDFHLARHRQALNKVRQKAEENAVVETEDGSEGTNLSIAQQQAEFAAEQAREEADNVVHRAEAGVDTSLSASPVSNQGEEV